MSFFDKKIHTATLWCHICKRDTTHDRPDSPSALWTCRDPKHPHPSKEQQEAGMRLPSPTPADEMKRAAQLQPPVVIKVKK